jgi:hypothetical protein
MSNQNYKRPESDSNKIQTSDLASVKNLLDGITNKKNKIIKFDKFEKDPHYIIKMAFKNRNEVAIKPSVISFRALVYEQSSNRGDFTKVN